MNNLNLSQMTVTVWIKQEIVLNWCHYKNHLDEIFDITKREPGDLNMMQVNLTPEEYQEIITPKR